MAAQERARRSARTVTRSPLIARPIASTSAARSYPPNMGRNCGAIIKILRLSGPADFRKMAGTLTAQAQTARSRFLLPITVKRAYRDSESNQEGTIVDHVMRTKTVREYPGRHKPLTACGHGDSETSDTQPGQAEE